VGNAAPPISTFSGAIPGYEQPGSNKNSWPRL
jgi:hypothetical protein